MTAAALDFRNTNTLWGSILVESLVRSGLRQAVLCPGSRCAPLTLAFSTHPQVEAIPMLDERSAGFFALGLARQHGKPVALICTSGSAAANFLPAVIEAREAGVPLIVLTADRPPEMRDCSSGQAIDQLKLYGSHVCFFHDLAVPEARVEMLRYLRQTAAHAWRLAIQADPGPVHLNCPFRDPLDPREDPVVASMRDAINDEFFAHLGSRESPAVAITARQRPTTTRGLIVAGPYAARDAASYLASLTRLATALQWPVLADALSPARHYALSEVVAVSTYDTILRNPALARDLTPRYVLCLGTWPTSKILRGWLEQTQAEMVLVSSSRHNRDALHGRTRVLPLAVENIEADAHGAADTSYREAWRAADAAARAALDADLAARTDLFEGKAVWLLSRSLPEETPVFVANSTPVRDVEWFWSPASRRIRIHYNRGANGIDGTLSTALGIAHGNQPTVLLTGDLALLHDSNGFLLRSKLRGSLTIVLINNRGGGIFEHLAIAHYDPPFEEFIAMPQTVDFAALCAAHGVEHVLITEWTQFTALVSRLPASGIRVLELQTDRKRDAATRKRLFAAAADAANRSE